MKPTTKLVIIIGAILIAVTGIYFVFNGDLPFDTPDIPFLQTTTPQTPEEMLVGDWNLVSIDEFDEWDTEFDVYISFGSGGLAQLFFQRDEGVWTIERAFTWHINGAGDLVVHTDTYYTTPFSFSPDGNTLYLETMGDGSTATFERRL